MRNLLKNLATMFGIGKIKKAPGTFGTLAAIPIYLLLFQAGPLIYMIAVLFLAVIGVIACQVYESDKGTHDSQEIVIDEVVGFLITMVWMPMTWQAILIGFALFRLLDITKPLLIGYLDKKVQGGLGVMVDDIVAGVIASIVMQLLFTHTNLLGSQILVSQ